MPWSPPGSPAQFHETLTPGVPPWMRTTLKDWFRQHVGRSAHKLAATYDSASRNRVPCANAAALGMDALLAHLGEEKFLHFLDFAVYVSIAEDPRYDEDWFDPDLPDALEIVLSDAGSEWRVGNREDHPGLEKRVPEGVQAAADRAMNESGSAGVLLSEAWHAAFGRSPNPEEAYEKAIKAVEEAASPVIEPNNTKSTLGTTIRTMRDQGDWELPLVNSNGEYFEGVTLRMCQALWNGQPSRHGGNEYRKPSQEEAEAAVFLAVPLVQWFASAAIDRRS